MRLGVADTLITLLWYFRILLGAVNASDVEQCEKILIEQNDTNLTESQSDLIH